MFLLGLTKEVVLGWEEVGYGENYNRLKFEYQIQKGVELESERLVSGPSCFVNNGGKPTSDCASNLHIQMEV